MIKTAQKKVRTIWSSLKIEFPFFSAIEGVLSPQNHSPDRSSSVVEAKLARLQASLRAANTNL